ncbi:serine/threonine protein kinase [Gluconobacter sphaericus]|uniref:serine/threonine protein kinase n=1 Tax=Gluconobacter sphaericus TaxID=574987 RepID=UPI001B8DA75F|nr:serine/threonine-protein kinase [Gluconobacter sphaericus]MBS1098431.1 serine/threonine protein kinase [Gluconobacter sphaericus]
MVSYTTVREIGRGGFGLVEEVETKKGEKFATKTLVYPSNASKASKADLRARFEREVKYQSAIDHRHVVPILDKNLKDDPPWFVMPLAEGSLQKELRVDRTLGGSPKEALFDLLAGLEEIHRLGYKHRDLSPGNVLRFSNEDGSIYYAISDFGLMSPQAGVTTTLTDTNVAGGTLPYRAPECATSFRRATEQADIYSVGAILHDIFGAGGRIPHAELKANGKIGEVIAKCTKTNPKRRYKNVQELREALYDVLHSADLKFESDEELYFGKLLQDNDALTDEQWDELFAHIDRQDAAGKSTQALMSAIRRPHVEGLLLSAPELFHALGMEYAKFASKYSFDFDFCDLIATIAQLFYDNGEIDLQANIMLAMLGLGTSHNRWFVERKFVSMAAPSISDELAQRIVTEIEVQEFDIKRQLRRLRKSITIEKDALHPKIEALGEDD